jgi:ABC-type branched-subunit amino acid transport system ATPase component/ABC-type branched-subunit amino acid transport system permease subunit
MAVSTSSAESRPRWPRPSTRGLLANTHWLVGAAFLLLMVTWLRTDIGGATWTSQSRQNLYIANVLMLYMLVAIGLNLISGFVGAGSIGHIGFFAIGAYAEAILTTEYGWHVWPAALAAAFIAAVAALPVGLILLRLSGWYFSVVTLLLVVVVNDLIIQQKDLTHGGAGIFGLSMPYIGRHQLDSRDYVYFLGAVNVAAFLMLRYLVDRSRWGKAFVAVRQAEPAARAVGIHPFVVQEGALAISAFLAGMAGALFAPLPGIITPDSFPILDSVFFLLAILAGGMGTIPGPVVGTLALYIVPQWLNRQESLKDYSFLVYGMLLLLLVIFLPEGIVGGVRRLWYRVFWRWLGPRKAPMTAASAAEGSAGGPGALAYVERRGLKGRAGEFAIETAGIHKKFGDIAALLDVNVRVRPGTIHGVIGPNGSGKTTLLNVISGFYRQERGTVRTFGRTIRRGRASASIRQGIARTFQTPQMLPALTGLENVMLGCHARGRVTMVDGMLPLPHVWRERKRFERTARACIELVGLGPEAAATPVGALPFAHQRLLEVARAIAGEPSVILLDEPASGLHPDEVRQFAGLIRRLRDAGLTIVLVEHNFALVGELSDTITVLDAGSLIAEGDFETVRNDPAVVEAYLGA